MAFSFVLLPLVQGGLLLIRCCCCPPLLSSSSANAAASAAADTCCCYCCVLLLLAELRAARPFAVFCSDFCTLECTLCDYALCYSAFASFRSLSCCCCCFSDSSSAFCRACACALSSFAEHRSLQTTLVKRPSAGFSSLVDSSRFSLLLPRTLGGALWSPRVFEGCFRSSLASLFSLLQFACRIF